MAQPGLCSDPSSTREGRGRAKEGGGTLNFGVRPAARLAVRVGVGWGWRGTSKAVALATRRRRCRCCPTPPGGSRGAGRGPNACASCPADEPGAWSGPAAAAPGLQEVGASLEDVLSPFSPSHPAPPSDPSHQISPDPTWDIQREHDVRKPKELSAGGQKKQRLGEQRERSASPQRAARPRLEEAPAGQGRPEV